MRPELQDQVASHHVTHPPHELIRKSGRPGDLAVVVSANHRRQRVVLITAADGATRTLRVLLASNQTEMATDLDAIVRPKESGAPYDLLVQGEFYGTISEGQVCGYVERVDAACTEASAAALDSDGASLDGCGTGTPLGGVDDPRRSFKDDELDDLVSLVSACRSSR